MNDSMKSFDYSPIVQSVKFDDIQMVILGVVGLIIAFILVRNAITTIVDFLGKKETKSLYDDPPPWEE